MHPGQNIWVIFSRRIWKICDMNRIIAPILLDNFDLITSSPRTENWPADAVDFPEILGNVIMKLFGSDGLRDICRVGSDHILNSSITGLICDGWLHTREFVQTCGISVVQVAKQDALETIQGMCLVFLIDLHHFLIWVLLDAITSRPIQQSKIQFAIRMVRRWKALCVELEFTDDDFTIDCIEFELHNLMSGGESHCLFSTSSIIEPIHQEKVMPAVDNQTACTLMRHRRALKMIPLSTLLNGKST